MAIVSTPGSPVEARNGGWQEAVRTAVRDGADLCRRLQLPPTVRRSSQACRRCFPGIRPAVLRGQDASRGPARSAPPPGPSPGRRNCRKRPVTATTRSVIGSLLDSPECCKNITGEPCLSQRGLVPSTADTASAGTFPMTQCSDRPGSGPPFSLNWPPMAASKRSFSAAETR